MAPTGESIMSRSCQSRGDGPAEVCAWCWVTGGVISTVSLAKESVVGGGLWPAGSTSGRLGVWQGRQNYRPARLEDMTEGRRRGKSRADGLREGWT